MSEASAAVVTEMPSDFVPEQATLWIERGFSRREITSRMIAAVPDMQVYTTPEQPVRGTQQLEFPSWKEPAAIDLINDYVAKNKVSDLWVQDGAKYDLSDIDCTVHAAAAPEVIRLVDDKAAFDEWLGSDPYRPGVSEVVGAEAVAEEYVRRRDEGHEVCIKPAIGVGGRGYWKLTEAAAGTLLKDPSRLEIHPDIYLSSLAMAEKEEEPQRLIMMDWLPGPEISVDILCWRGQPLIHAARTKVDRIRTGQRVQSEHSTVGHARTMAARLAMHGIVSMQYRLDREGEWKMLEINPRPAGGSIYSEDAGFGLISGWASLIANRLDTDQLVQKDGAVELEIGRHAKVL